MQGIEIDPSSSLNYKVTAIDGETSKKIRRFSPVHFYKHISSQHLS
jgi:hypothetical protein